MRGILVAVGVIAVVLALVGLLVEAVQWLLAVGLIALLAAIVIGVVQARRLGSGGSAPPR